MSRGYKKLAPQDGYAAHVGGNIRSRKIAAAIELRVMGYDDYEDLNTKRVRRARDRLSARAQKEVEAYAMVVCMHNHGRAKSAEAYRWMGQARARYAAAMIDTYYTSLAMQADADLLSGAY